VEISNKQNAIARRLLKHAACTQDADRLHIRLALCRSI